MQMSTSAVDNVDTAPQVASSGSKQLLEDDGALSRDAEAALEVIFRKYATSISATSADSHASSSAAPIEKLSIKPEGLTAFGLETNGQALPQEQVRCIRMLAPEQVDEAFKAECTSHGQIEEIKTYFDCDYHENILFSGFLQVKVVLVSFARIHCSNVLCLRCISCKQRPMRPRHYAT